MPKNKVTDDDEDTTSTTAVYKNNGQTFSRKRDADNYGLIVQKVNDFASDNDLDEDFVEKALEAFRGGAFDIPKATRKPKEA